eukprot:PhF_6_TR40497/c0_g1_i1/m.60593
MFIEKYLHLVENVLSPVDRQKNVLEYVESNLNLKGNAFNVMTRTSMGTVLKCNNLSTDDISNLHDELQRLVQSLNKVISLLRYHGRGNGNPSLLLSKIKHAYVQLCVQITEGIAKWRLAFENPMLPFYEFGTKNNVVLRMMAVVHEVSAGCELTEDKPLGKCIDLKKPLADATTNMYAHSPCRSGLIDYVDISGTRIRRASKFILGEWELQYKRISGALSDATNGYFTPTLLQKKHNQALSEESSMRIPPLPNLREVHIEWCQREMQNLVFGTWCSDVALKTYLRNRSSKHRRMRSSNMQNPFIPIVVRYMRLWQEYALSRSDTRYSIQVLCNRSQTAHLKITWNRWLAYHTQHPILQKRSLPMLTHALRSYCGSEIEITSRPSSRSSQTRRFR